MKRALMIASMASMLDNFNRDNIELLNQEGYEITLAANFKTEDSNSPERVKRFKHNMEEKGFRIIHIDFTRKISNWKGQIRSFRQVKQLAEEEFDLVHCHSPICAAMTRLAFRKKRRSGVKIIYTAHGFHFFKGAPWINWLIYFPVEWVCAHFTDVLLTINFEDHKRANKWFKAKKVEYIPGIGIDTEKFQKRKFVGRKEKREALGIKEKDTMLLSVGELNSNKNHQVVIRAVAGLKNKMLHYVVAGQGGLFSDLRALAEQLQIADQVHLIGFQEDVASLYQCADLYLLPSKREGLNISLLEAMSSGLPCVVSKIRGNVDLVAEGEGGFLIGSEEVTAWAEGINKLVSSPELRERMGEQNQKRSFLFGRTKVSEKMHSIYKELK